MWVVMRHKIFQQHLEARLLLHFQHPNFLRYKVT